MSHPYTEFGRHPMTWDELILLATSSDISHPRFSSEMGSYDVASDICHAPPQIYTPDQLRRERPGELVLAD